MNVDGLSAKGGKCQQFDLKKKLFEKNKTCIDAADFMLSAKYENQQVVVRNRATSEVTEQFVFFYLLLGVQRNNTGTNGGL